ncbi:ABC transporter permease [Streptomyces daliensis]|uniref:ABC transporter permease n=1 Tax=Streptomyces daliensis TaxID=299421 RepID=A0A8T4IQE6_9ACTN|nr:ABC transporter permease [Streptomyces daliensis]
MRNSPLVAELRDAITPRAFLLMTAVFLVQLGFLLSYIGSFHHPEPQRVPLAVAAPQQVADRFDALPGEPLDTTVVKDEKAARERVEQRKAEAAFVADPRSSKDTLLVASATGSSVTEAVTKVVKEASAKENRQVAVYDMVPAHEQDQGSLTAFYLVIGWLVGGYLAASMLGVTAGARPANVRRAVIRLGVMAVYAVLSGIGGAVIVDPALGALPGHFWALTWLGTLIVFGTGAVTIALQVLFGVIGIGLAILIFVVLGNPSAGGAYQSSMIPPFWRAIGDWLTPGAGTHAVRNIAYFHGNALTGPLWVLAAWAVAGVVLALLGATRERRETRREGLPI